MSSTIDTSSVPIPDPPTPDEPHKSWDDDRLGNFIKHGFAECNRLEEESINCLKRSALWLYRIGEALSIIADRKKAEGKLMEWLKKRNQPYTPCKEAIRLFERCDSDEERARLATMTIGAAKKWYQCGSKDYDPALNILQNKGEGRRAEKKRAPATAATGTGQPDAKMKTAELTAATAAEGGQADTPPETATPTPDGLQNADQGDTVDRFMETLGSLTAILDAATEDDWHRAEDRLGNVLGQIDEVTEKLGEVRKVLGKIAPLGQKPEKTKKTRRQNADAETPEKTPRSRSKLGDD